MLVVQIGRERAGGDTKTNRLWDFVMVDKVSRGISPVVHVESGNWIAVTPDEGGERRVDRCGLCRSCGFDG